MFRLFCLQTGTLRTKPVVFQWFCPQNTELRTNRPCIPSILSSDWYSTDKTSCFSVVLSSEHRTEDKPSPYSIDFVFRLPLCGQNGSIFHRFCLKTQWFLRAPFRWGFSYIHYISNEIVFLTSHTKEIFRSSKGLFGRTKATKSWLPEAVCPDVHAAPKNF